MLVKDDLALQKAADLIMENVKERATPKKKAKEEDKDTDKEEKYFWAIIEADFPYILDEEREITFNNTKENFLVR